MSGRDARPRVLIVDDVEDNRVIFGVLFEGVGAEVARASSGAEGVAMAKSNLTAGTPYDLIVMDILMPDLDGNQATAQIRDAGYRGMIVALTALPSGQGRRQSGASGIDAYFSKTVMTKELAGTLLEQCRLSKNREG